jgi:hypothetical protein
MTFLGLITHNSKKSSKKSKKLFTIAKNNLLYIYYISLTKYGGKVHFMYLDFFFVFLVQNDKIWSEMNKKDKIEARKAIFDMHKVLIDSWKNITIGLFAFDFCFLFYWCTFVYLSVYIVNMKKKTKFFISAIAFAWFMNCHIWI